MRVITPKSRSPRAKAAELGGDGLVQRQAALGAEVGTVAHLQIAEMSRAASSHHLVRHPLDRLGRLQHRDGGVEPLRYSSRFCASIHQHEPAERLGVVGGQCDAGVAGELDQRLGPERAVEVHMQLRLGQPRDAAHA